jgi:multidrug transporter EmrE-like cation transporter
MTPILTSALITLFATLFESVGLTILRAGGPYALPIASAIYAVAVVPLLSYSLRYEGIGMSNFLWNIFSTLIMFGIGIYIFREKIQYLQLIGVCIAFLGIGLVLLAPEKSST